MGDRDGTARIASPYGEREVHPDTAGAIDYVEKGYDADLGLVRMGVRDYDPKIGRFLTPDPLYLETLDKCVQSPVQCNLYGYAAGNPLLYEDSTGLESKYRETFNTFAAPLFWAGMVYGLVQGYAPGGAFLPPPGQDARFELGRAVGLGTAATAQVVTAGVAGFGAAATLGGGPTAVGAPALVAEAAQQLSMATVNVVAAVAAWQNAAQMAAASDGGSSGNSRNDVGRAREERVAELTGGRVARMPGSTTKDLLVRGGGKGVRVDVVGPNGELIVVGGPSKAANLGGLGDNLTRLKTVAEANEVRALAYFEEGTPSTAVDLAKKILGDENVKLFTMGTQ